MSPDELARQMLEGWEAHQIPGFVTQLINHTVHGLIGWRQTRPHTYQLLVRGGRTIVKSQGDDGLAPYVLVTGSGKSAVESVGQSDDPVYNAAFRALFVAAAASSASEQLS